ncbi:MAG: FAD-dependent monooxygenase [Synechococcus sp.]|nr:FAD-dependent monooxygenase [Synechococcus sp.]
MAASSVVISQHPVTDREPNGSLSVFVYGAGPTGAVLALGLASLGCQVDLHDPLSGEEICRRSRAYAITQSSRRLLERLDLWEALQPHLIGFDQLRLEDQAVGPVVWFRQGDLIRANRHAGAIGWILDHQALMQLLLERLRAAPGVSLHLGSRRGLDELTLRSAPDLEVAADGPQSLHRKTWQLPLWSLPYRQGCLTVKVLLRGADPATAHEFFRSEGPFAVLPLGGQAFQLVWSAPLDRCQERAALNASELLDLLATVLPAGLIPDALLDQPRAFPLELSLAPRLTHGSRMLVGEAGHRCHPVGGQGLNLCWRDVADLLDLVSQHHRHPKSLRHLVRRYTRRRLPDLILVALSTDGLLRLFSNRLALLLPLRSMALGLLMRIRLLRRLALQAMSDGPMTFVQAPPEWRAGGRCHGAKH